MQFFHIPHSGTRGRDTQYCIFRG